MILPVLRRVFTPALKLPVFRHDIEMAMPSYLASLHSPLIKKRTEAVPHGTSKTKAGEQLTIGLGIEPDFVDQFVFHGSRAGNSQCHSRARSHHVQEQGATRRAPTIRQAGNRRRHSYPNGDQGVHSRAGRTVAPSPTNRGVQRLAGQRALRAALVGYQFDGRDIDRVAARRQVQRDRRTEVRNGWRTIPIPPALVDALKVWKSSAPRVS